jgi:hypothetical protein
MQPPVDEKMSGLVCYITVAGFLTGRGFEKMRADLRRDCDEVWVIDCSPEGHQPKVATRIFQGVQQPVCIVLASRSPANDPDVPAKVRFRALPKDKRDEKFKQLATVTLDGKGWSDCPFSWRAPFLPESVGAWANFPPLDIVLGDSGSGVMPGRTWVIAPDEQSPADRWRKLVNEPSKEERAKLFHPHLRKGKPGDRHVGKAGKALDGSEVTLFSIEQAPKELGNPDPKLRALAQRSQAGEQPVRYGFRSFDRQWICPDARLINQPNPTLRKAYGKEQVFLTAPMDRKPSDGPGLTASGTIPDLHHYAGRGGRVFALWKDAAATQANVSDGVLAELAKRFGTPVDPKDVFAYVAGLLGSPAYTKRFKDDLLQPGPRVPLTADRKLFRATAALGRKLIWLHSFGERMAANRACPPRVPVNPPTNPKEGRIPSAPDQFPDSIDYDAGLRRLKIGGGYIDNVRPEVWSYQVSGKNVLRQWFSYRRKTRDRPQIGDRRPPSKLGEIQPLHWLPEYTTELLNVLNVLTLLVELEPKQAALLDRICVGPLIPASRITG